MASSFRVEIIYCVHCGFLLRAGWLAQELLDDFANDLTEVALVPSTGGIFEVKIDEVCLWSRQQEGRFPDAKELKQRLRDHVAPERSLGHSD